MLVYILIILVAYYFFFERESFTQEEDFAEKVMRFLHKQSSKTPKGDYKEYLVFLDTLKNTNMNIERLSNYYYLFELAKDDKLRPKDVLNKMK
jgi:hypothetical protein